MKQQDARRRNGSPSIIRSLARCQVSAPQKSREASSRNVTLLRSQPRRENESAASPMHKMTPACIPPRKKWAAVIRKQNKEMSPGPVMASWAPVWHPQHK